MKRKNFRIAALIMLITLVGSGAHAAYQSGDFQIWNTNEQSVAIGKGTKFTTQQEFRYGNGGGDIFYQHYDWGFAFAFDKMLELALGYRLVYEKPKDKWMEEDHYYTNITPKFEIWNFKIEDRNRIVYRQFKSPTPNQLRYRNRIMVKYPIDFKKIVIAPYVSNEIFVSSNGTGFNQNRLESGVELGLTKYVKMDVSYMQQQVRGLNDKWVKANVLWLRSKITF
jgi:hypothetical protein